MKHTKTDPQKALTSYFPVSLLPVKAWAGKESLQRCDEALPNHGSSLQLSTLINTHSDSNHGHCMNSTRQAFLVLTESKLEAGTVSLAVKHRTHSLSCTYRRLLLLHSKLVYILSLKSHHLCKLETCFLKTPGSSQRVRVSRVHLGLKPAESIVPPPFLVRSRISWDSLSDSVVYAVRMAALHSVGL
ncbi:hypothetical protein BaRGS_00009288 [Batillaria attramentaria]|uniref:Uncharacterized protein n=1 Tax=Batillaria attramentaria TaxID=370345 RepID=A0ABD0LKB1_9CAEN